jgi:hypothetical protein
MTPNLRQVPLGQLLAHQFVGLYYQNNLPQPAVRECEWVTFKTTTRFCTQRCCCWDSVCAQENTFGKVTFAQRAAHTVILYYNVTCPQKACGVDNALAAFTFCRGVMNGSVINGRRINQDSQDGIKLQILLICTWTHSHLAHCAVHCLFKSCISATSVCKAHSLKMDCRSVLCSSLVWPLIGWKFKPLNALGKDKINASQNRKGRNDALFSLWWRRWKKVLSDDAGRSNIRCDKAKLFLHAPRVSCL